MKIAVLYNKPSVRFTKDRSHIAAESDTEISAREVGKALKHKGAIITLVPVKEDAIVDVVGSVKADLVFNLIEWTGVDTAYAMATFDELDKRGIRYTGATKQNYFDTCDKMITKKLCQKYQLPTATWQEFVTGQEPVQKNLPFPLIVKVAREHSSVGITKESIAHDADSLNSIVTDRIAEFHQPVFAETFLTGREFQVTLIETKQGLKILPPAEIVYTKGTDVPLLTYESRWNEHHHDYQNSEVELASLTPELSHTLVALSTNGFHTFRFRDYARFDIRCDADENPYFLELNSNPGLSDDPDYGMTVSYKAAGMTFADFIWEIVESAIRRYS